MTSPIKYSLKTEIFPILLGLLSVIFSFYFYSHFPDRVVTHWDFQGQPNGYSSRLTATLMFPALIVGCYLLFLVIPFLDPRRDRYEAFSGTYHFFKGSILGVLFMIFLVTGFSNIGHAGLKINLIVPFSVGVLFVLLGNSMGKLKKNWFIGIRTPWTLSSENVWNKTHRVGGRLMALCGLLIMLTPLLPQAIGMVVFMTGVVIFAGGTFVYSYYLYRKEQEEQRQQPKELQQ